MSKPKASYNVINKVYKITEEQKSIAIEAIEYYIDIIVSRDGEDNYIKSLDVIDVLNEFRDLK
jgi:hypothetical protein